MKNLLISTILTFSIFCSVNAQQLGTGYAATSDNFNTYLLSGVYQTGVSQIGFPGQISNTWNHLFVIRHSNANMNHQFQLASSYAENDRLFFRKISSSALVDKNTTWYELATRGANTFTGKQLIDGGLQIGVTRSGTIPVGYGDQLSLGGSENTDYLWLSRYTVGPNTTELRVNIGDDRQDTDRFAIGSTAWDTKVWNEVFAVTMNGNVGIGVPFPKNKLDVNGTIHAKEVKIDNSNWPDYVFANDYQLPSLTSVSNFIEENRHLPDIPSAVEVETNGVSVGEMQAKLLQKVEELTLYLIQQNETISELKKEINTLKGNQ